MVEAKKAGKKLPAVPETQLKRRKIRVATTVRLAQKKAKALKVRVFLFVFLFLGSYFGQICWIFCLFYFL